METSWEKELRKEYFRGAGIQVFDLNTLSMDEIRIKVNEPFSSTNDPCPTKFPKILSRLIHLIGAEAKEYKGYVPPQSVVIPGSYPKEFPAGTYHVPCAMIIGKRKASTDKKTSLNDALREYQVAV